MKKSAFRILSIATLLVLLAFGCGEDPVESGDNDATDNSTEEPDENNDENGMTECAEDETYNPVRDECQKNDEENDDPNDNPNNDPNNGENNDDDPPLNDASPDCEDDEILDPSTDECVHEDEYECGPGDIDGQTCRPDGGVLPGAEVTVEGVDCNGDSFTETAGADNEGYYYFEDIDSGEHELTITSGSFSVTEPVLVANDQVTNLKGENSKVCLQGDEVNIAVLEGSWDDIPGLLDGMNINYDVITPLGGNTDNTAEFLGDIDAMNEYDIIFFACYPTYDVSSNPFGVSMADIEQNIRTYIESGNSIYASDFAQTFIQYPIPEAIEFYNDDGTDSGPRQGSGGQTVTADVTSDEMETLLGSSTTDIYFDTVFAIALDGGPGSQVHFRGDVAKGGGDIVEDAALMTSYHDLIGGGHVIFTSFHNSEQATDDIQDVLEFMIFQL